MWNFSWSVCPRVGFGVTVFDLDFWVQIASIEQPIVSNSVGSRNMSHCRTSSFYDHLDHCVQSFHEFSSALEMYTSLLVLVLWCVFPWKTVTIRSHNSRAGKPSNLSPVSKEMISDSVELCETAVCFLHIQQIGTKEWLQKKSQCLTRSGFWVHKISRKIKVLKQSQSALFSSITHMIILFVFTCVMKYEFNRFRRLSHALVHFVMDRASLFTDHRISGRPIRTNI